jgi:hypothetical protein
MARPQSRGFEMEESPTQTVPLSRLETSPWPLLLVGFVAFATVRDAARVGWLLAAAETLAVATLGWMTWRRGVRAAFFKSFSVAAIRECMRLAANAAQPPKPGEPDGK